MDLVQTNTSIEQNKRKAFNAFSMDRVTSSEYYLKIGAEPRQILQGISLDIKRNELWAITGKSKLELTLLLEIMANIKPYQSGTCMLLERGMLRHKRFILPNIFYIGNTSMIYNNMKVLEFLMFASANNNFDVVSQQERIFEQLISFGLGNISLTPIFTLSQEYKALILLIAAAYSTSQLIIMNLPELEYDELQISAFNKITGYMRSLERTLVISTLSTEVIKDVFDHTAILYKGNLIFKGKTENLLLKYDKTNSRSIKNASEEIFKKYDL